MTSLTTSVSLLRRKQAQNPSHSFARLLIAFVQKYTCDEFLTALMGADFKGVSGGAIVQKYLKSPVAQAFWHKETAPQF